MANFVSEFILSKLSAGAGGRLMLYGAALRNACELDPPPYGKERFGKEYHRLARDSSWFASLLASNVNLEGYSAKQLWSYARNIIDPRWSASLRAHAIDEARHSRIFAKLLFAIFPSTKSDSLQLQLERMCPVLSEASAVDGIGERPFEELLNSTMLINLYEGKALILEQLLQPTILAYCAPQEATKLRGLTDALITDEVRHIEYTAMYLEEAASSGFNDYIVDGMADFQRMLNLSTLDELQQTLDLYSGENSDLSQPCA